MLIVQTGSMASGDLGPLNETAQAVRVMKEKYIQWQQRLDALIAQVQIHNCFCGCHSNATVCYAAHVIYSSCRD